MQILHIGDHSALSALSALLHLAEPDHIFFIALAAACAILGYRSGRRAEARAIAKKDENRP